MTEMERIEKTTEIFSKSDRNSLGTMIKMPNAFNMKAGDKGSEYVSASFDSSKEFRDEKDEKHICPLQLSVIRRAIDLWSNPGETVLTPFMGIGSEAYIVLERERKAIGIELKPTWFEQAVKNCKSVINTSTQIGFDL